MDDPFFGRWWDRFPQRSSQRSPYSSHPYADASVTPIKPEYDYQGAAKIKPKTFIVPVDGPPTHPSPNSSSETKWNIPAKPNHKNVVRIPIDSEVPKSSSSIKKAVPRMDETSAATKMQSAFRGFSARKGAPLKNLRVIRDVKAESEAIRRRLADHQVVESIFQNEKERLKITEWIMSLLLKLDAIQGVNSFVRESRKAATREIVNLQEMVDAIIAGKSIQGTASMGAQAAEDDNHGDEIAVSVKENGEDGCSERVPNKEEIRDEELLESGPNEEESRDEALQDGAKLASSNHSEVQEEVTVLSDRIESQKMPIESPNHSKDDSGGIRGNGGEELHEEVVSEEPVDLNENYPEDQEYEPHDVEVMRDSIFEEKCTNGASICVEHTGEGLRALESHNIPCTDEEVVGHSIDEEELPNIASDSEVQTCKRLKASVCSQAVANTIQADEHQRHCEGMEYEETGENGAVENAKDEEVAKVKEENERLKKTVDDLLKKNKFQNELITNLSLRIGQIEEQISKSKRKKTVDKKKKTKETDKQ